MMIKFLKQCLVDGRVYRPADEVDFEDLSVKKTLVRDGVAEWYDPDTTPKRKKADVKHNMEIR